MPAGAPVSPPSARTSSCREFYRRAVRASATRRIAPLWNNRPHAGAMDQVRPDGAARVRRRVCLARRRAAEERGADPLMGGGGGPLSVRADRAAQARAGARIALALLGPGRRGRDLPAIPRSGISRRRNLPARARHRADARACVWRMRGDRVELPDALPRQLRRDTVVRARAGISPAPGSAARLELRVLVAERAREPAYFCPRSFLSCSSSFATSAS